MLRMLRYPQVLLDAAVRPSGTIPPPPRMHAEAYLPPVPHACLGIPPPFPYACLGISPLPSPMHA